MRYCKDVVNFIKEIAPEKLAEDWDNVGLLIGSPKNEVKRILVCVDVTSAAVDYAVKLGADLIISHHPIIFKPLKSINTDDYKGKIIEKLIKNNISVYCSHTNFDVAEGGINDCLAELLELKNIKILNKYKSEKLYKIVVYVPEENSEAVREALCDAGAGWIGAYSDCTFMVKGTGTFKPREGTNPYIGTRGNLEKVPEIRLETVVWESGLQKAVANMLAAHPYEEVAYDVFSMKNDINKTGLGKIGELSAPVSMSEFIGFLKKKLNTDTVRVIGNKEEYIKKVAVFCGAFDGNWSGVMREKPDVLVTGDIKYNTAVEIVEMGLCVIDAGHFNTEAVFKNRMVELLKANFNDIDIESYIMEADPINIC